MPPTRQTFQFCPTIHVYDAAMLSGLDKVLIAVLNLVLTAEDASLLACVFVASAGMLLGYSVARLAGLLPRQRHGVSLETGVQNAPLAIAVILATFPDAEHDALLKLPFLYAMTALCMGTLATFAYRRFPAA